MAVGDAGAARSQDAGTEEICQSRPSRFDAVTGRYVKRRALTPAPGSSRTPQAQARLPGQLVQSSRAAFW